MDTFLYIFIKYVKDIVGFCIYWTWLSHEIILWSIISTNIYMASLWSWEPQLLGMNSNDFKAPTNSLAKTWLFSDITQNLICSSSSNKHILNI